MIECKNCGIPWAQKRLRQHVSACKGKIQGFSPYFHGGRYMQQCQRCLKSMREARTTAHSSVCKGLQHVQEKGQVLDATLPSVVLTASMAANDNLAVVDAESQQDEQQMEEQAPFIYEKPESPSNILFHCPLRGETIIMDIDEEEEEIDMTPPKAPTIKELNHQAIQASLSAACATKKKFRSKKIGMFRENYSQFSPKLSTVIELCVLSALLRLIGKYTQEQKWELKKMVVNKKELYDFLKEVQPWITSNEHFFNIAREKVKLYEQDDQTLIVLNFQQLYLRVKQMIEIYEISPSKIERIFTTPLQKRCSLKRRHRRDPDTYKMRRKIIDYFSRFRKEKIIRKRKYGMRPETKLKYEGLAFIVSNADKVYQMKQLFGTRPSATHRKSVMRRRGVLMEQFCLKAIADDITASVILGEFKVWSKKIEDIPPEKRYLYHAAPNMPAFNIWYPVPESVLREKRWLFLSIYKQCQTHFESPLPPHTQQSLFQRVTSWYKNNNLISRYNLYEIEEYDEIRAVLDHEYRIKQQKKRISKLAAKSVQYAHSMAFRQDQDDFQEKDEARRKMVGDNKRWFLTDEGFNKTAYEVCSLCEEPLTYPALTCQNCVSMYHPKCKSKILHTCLCESLYGDNDDEAILSKAINDARTSLKQVSLDIKLPPKASMMELAFQEQQLEIHLNPRPAKSWSKGSLTFYCDKSTSLNHYSQKITFLNKKSLLFYEKFGTQFVYPGVIVEIPGKGKGLLASRDINKGEIVANYVGRLITDAETTELFKDNTYIYTFQYGNTPFNTFNIVPDAVGSIGIFMNHSSNPNCVGGRYWTDKGPLLIFIATKRIKMKEQICYDYGKNYPGVQNFI